MHELKSKLKVNLKHPGFQVSSISWCYIIIDIIVFVV